MRKTLCLLLAVLSAMCLLSGCTLFDKEYRVVKKYEAQSGDSAPAAEEFTNMVTDYDGLCGAITALVEDHVESAELQFQSYEGNVSQDLSTACWEVKSSTALGAFAVDYISYDLSRIVSYYQAEIHITYKRSEYQISALEKTGSMSALSARLGNAVRGGETYLVLEISAASATEQTVEEYVRRSYYADPLSCPALPEVDVSIFPESGVTRIMEITLTYPWSSEELSASREALGLGVDIMADAVRTAAGPEASPAENVHAMCLYLNENCVYDPEAGSTAWDALSLGMADSEGIAMAMTAGCQALDISCQAVSGRLDGEDHWWNIITLDGASYHVDVSNWPAGEAQVFLVGDEKLWGAYWWDTSVYPVCSMDYDGSETDGTAAVSAEPADPEQGKTP